MVIVYHQALWNKVCYKTLQLQLELKLGHQQSACWSRMGSKSACWASDACWHHVMTPAWPQATCNHSTCSHHAAPEVHLPLDWQVNALTAAGVVPWPHIGARPPTAHVITNVLQPLEWDGKMMAYEPSHSHSADRLWKNVEYSQTVYTVEYRYKAVKFIAISHIAPRWERQKINQTLLSQ